MNVYSFDETCVYEGITAAQEHPFKEGEFLVPGRATTVAPPTDEPGKWIWMAGPYPKEGEWIPYTPAPKSPEQLAVEAAVLKLQNNEDLDKDTLNLLLRLALQV